MKMLWVLTVLVTPLTLSYAIQTEYFVKPDNSTPCPGLPCHTLSHYLESTTQYFASNTRISFLPGVHEVDKVSVLDIKNVSNLTLAGYNVNVLRSHAAKIVCRRPAVLKFTNIANLVIMHLSIVYCGYPVITEKNSALNVNFAVAVFLKDITSVKLTNISVENGTGYGIMGENVLGNSSVSHSRFIFNNYYTLSSTNCSYGLGSCKGGNMFFIYNDGTPGAGITGSTSVLSIDSCVFSDGVDVSNKFVGRPSGGLAILMVIIQHNVNISIWNIVSTRNVVTNFRILILGNMETINYNVTNITSSNGNYLQQRDEAPYGTGFQFFRGKAMPVMPIPTTGQTHLYISESKFYDNNGGSVHLQLYELYKNVKFYVIIRNCSFQKNVNPNSRGVITAYSLRHLEIINCTFAMNTQTALQAIDSTLHFGGHVIFSGNNGTLGGALMLQGGSTFNLMPYTHVEIINNHAKRGGGIYVEDENPQVRGGGIYTENEIGQLPVDYLRACFFQVFDPHYSDSVVTLENNTADEAGSAIYGGNIDNCCIPLFTCQQLTYTRRMFPLLFKILDLPSHMSRISSNPFKVHMCNHSISEIHGAHVYPGQAFKISVVLYGQRNGSVPGTVRAYLVNKSRYAHFAPLQETQETGYLCKNLTYTIFSSGHYETIMLRVDGVHYYTNELGALINVTLLPCPPGFQFSNITAQCECAPMLKNRDLLCNISGATPLVQRTSSIWISTHYNGSDIMLHDHCPLNYCKPNRLWLHLNHSDEQCAHGRSGILCGRCNSNLSLTIGTSQCLECTNIYLALLIPFALAGLMLVLLLIICNLTVSMGTINGLIFYANIVWINNANFIKTPNVFGVRVLQQVLAVFIAWLNLDLGIETCFFHGMDVYIQTWLQFAFPFYIWMIVGVIIYLSRRSITIVKLVGSSAVSVLATLFLLSYAKLQRTVITAFSFTYVQNYYGDGRPLAVWLYDGNVPFLQGKHIALFLMALAVTLFFILPFTLLLLFAPCIQASNHFLVHWVKMKLNPLLDAYQGPYKDNFRFWTGLMLVVRSILFVGFGLNILGDPNINNLLIIVVLSCLVAGTGIRGIVYKSKIFHITEISFILNLLILSGWTIYNRHTPNGDSTAGQAALVCTSTGVAFATFICILTYHTYLRLKSTKLHLYFRRRLIEGGDGRAREAMVGSVESAVDAPPKHAPTVTMIELREPLLTDN